MSKHTPGPWRIDRIIAFAPTIMANGRRVAKVFHKDGIEDEQVLANAKLIAASPDLLEACTDLVQWFYDIGLDDDHSKEDGGLPDELIQARAAIQKATN